MEKLIVSKYGGSSVTSRSAIEHIGKITSDNKKRKIIVVSAPGKMHKDDTKVTDLLIQLSKNPKNSDLFNKVIEKLYSLGSSDPNIKTILEKRLERTLPPNEFEDSIKAFGEEASARITAQVLGLEYIDPKEIFVFSNDPGNAKILPESKRMTKARLGKLDKTVVIPGFFGYTKNGEIRTLSRGGSDLTGGYLAGILRAEAYENYTDSCILATDPGIVENPSNIIEMTYKEARDLSFAGFNILHHQAMLPTEETNVPIHVRSTKRYPEEGTFIKKDRVLDDNKPIVGVAYKSGFYSTFVEKSGLDDMLGIIYKLTGIFGKEQVQLLDIPGAIDEISFIYHKSSVQGAEQIKRIEDKILKTVGRKGTFIKTENNLGMIAVAGIGMAGKKGILGEISNSLSEAGVNIRTITQGVRERCILYGVEESQGKMAVQAIYEKFLR